MRPLMLIVLFLPFGLLVSLVLFVMGDFPFAGPTMMSASLCYVLFRYIIFGRLEREEFRCLAFTGKTVAERVKEWNGDPELQRKRSVANYAMMTPDEYSEWRTRNRRGKSA